MDEHPLPPDTHTPKPATPRKIGTLAVCLVSVLAIAAATLGAGVYMNRDSQAWQRILGTEPAPAAIFTPGDQLVPILDSVSLTNASNGTGGGAALRAAYTATQVMLTKHVGLLTPAALQPPAEPEKDSGEATAPPVVPQSPAAAKELAQELAVAGQELVEAAVKAPGQRARSLSGAGFELGMQARNLLQAAGGTQAQLDALPAPKLAAKPGAGTTGDPAAVPQFMLSSCPLAPGADSPAPASTKVSKASSEDTALPGSDAALGLVADAAYRLSYAYNVAEARTAGTLRASAAARSVAMAKLGSSIEEQFSTVGECEPLRQPAYLLPTGAASNPMDAARSGEEQLALLLRDAAATQEGEARAFLLQRAWEQGFYTRQVTGKIPGFTLLTADPVGEKPTSSQETPTP